MSEKITLSISGISCASCVVAIQSALKSFKGVTSASVNFASEKALIEFEPAITDIAAIERVIKATGYSVIKPTSAPSAGKTVLKMKVIGMDNPHCVGTVGGAISSLPGIISKDLRVNEKVGQCEFPMA